MNPFMGASINIAIPQIAEQFSLNATSLSWVAMSFLLSSAVFLVPLGKLADIVGRKKIFLIGSVVVTIASILCAFSISGAMLITFRSLQGIGSAMVFGTNMALLTSAFEPQERGKAIGLNVSVVYLGLSLAPVLGGFLTHHFGWQSLFVVTVPLGIISIIGTLTGIHHEWAEAKNERFDYKGSLVYVVAVTALMFGFSKLPDYYAIASVLLGIVGLMYFIHIELHVEFPVLNIALFQHNRTFAFSNLAALINYAATFAVSFILSLYLQYVKGFTPQSAGMILVAQPIVMILFSILSGRLSDKYDPRILTSLGMGIIVVGLIMLIFISPSTSNAYLLTSLGILGTGFGLFSSPNTTLIMNSVEKRFLGVASATVGTMRLTGQMFSMGISTLVIHLYLGNSQISKANSLLFLSSTRSMFLIFCILCILGVYASLARGKQQGK
jgi:EmrB/QacA subfamily drug resistance transporter